MPIEVPFKTHKIRKLPADLKQELDKMLSEGNMHSCRQLAKWLGDNGYRISPSAIHKYGRRFQRNLEAVRLATEQARIVCEEFKDDDHEMQEALLRLVQTQLFNVLWVSQGKGSGGDSNGEVSGPIAPVNLGALARSVSGLVRAESEHRKMIERMRAKVAVAEHKVQEAREKGLSKEAAEQIKSALMGV